MITMVDQTRLHDAAAGISGNCAQAAIASILGLRLDDVPDFTGGTIDEDPRPFWRSMERFLDALGLSLIRLDGNCMLDNFHLASGMSSRGVSHMVVRRGAEIVHDPHPDRSGLVDVRHVWILVPHDISAWLPSIVATDRALALDTILRPVRYDEHGYVVDRENGRVAEIRGWGRISYLDQAEARQDAIGKLIASLINGAS